MMDGLDPMRELLVRRKWDEAAAYIERLNDLTSNGGDPFPIHPGSSLAADDRASSPFRVSVTLHSCINAGVDHLHALKSLINDAGLLHVAAPFSLARGGLENFATAAWVLTGETREVRVDRTLRWHAQNAMDGDRAMGALSLGGPRPLSEQLALLDTVADLHNLGRNFRGGYRGTEAVKGAEAAFPDLRLGVLRPWQICSGFAHGRPWAFHGASLQERTDDEDPNMVNICSSASLDTVLYAALAATQLVQALLGLYKDRAKNGR